MPNRNYALASGRNLFVDDVTGLKLVRGDVVEMDHNEVGARTQTAIRHGHLVEVQSKTTKKKTDDSDLPEDIPGRDVFLKAGLSFDQVKTLSLEDVDKTKGIGEATLAKFVDYADWLKKDDGE